jgi:hypothetical protein
LPSVVSGHGANVRGRDHWPLSATSAISGSCLARRPFSRRSRQDGS